MNLNLITGAVSEAQKKAAAAKAACDRDVRAAEASLKEANTVLADLTARRVEIVQKAERIEAEAGGRRSQRDAAEADAKARREEAAAEYARATAEADPRAAQAAAARLEVAVEGAAAWGATAPMIEALEKAAGLTRSQLAEFDLELSKAQRDSGKLRVALARARWDQALNELIEPGLELAAAHEAAGMQLPPTIVASWFTSERCAVFGKPGGVVPIFNAELLRELNRKRRKAGE